MAPSPETDNTPKAPDKADKGRTTRGAEQEAAAAPESVTKDISVTSLDDGQLKELLDEALTYKTPRDREGKSELFKTLLTDAEDQIRKDKAKTASGPELARYYNTTANRRRNKRQPSSISENLTHGGSLNDLAKEELYVSASHLQRPKKTVSARQREGGSLPCNVNAGASYDKQFFVEEQAKRKNKIAEKLEYTAIDMESEFLLENDSLGQDYNSCSNDSSMEARVTRQPNMYMSKATLQISNVDDCISFPPFDRVEKVTSSCSTTDDTYKSLPEMPPHYGVLLNSNNKWSFNTARNTVLEEKKVDENGNALGHNNTVDSKKRKKSGKKAEDVIKAEDVKGHRADIIDNIDMLVEFISGEEKPTKSSVKSKLNKHMSEDKGKQHKQRTRSSKGAKAAGTHHHASLQKSNSMEEMSITKLEDFNFDSQDQPKLSESAKIPLRPTKSNAERPRERKSWVLCSELYQNASAENLESADFTFVTKKKKSKKRRNSLGSRKHVHGSEGRAAEFHRVPSPRRKSVCSAPHSEKSIDSSDADSVNSMSIEDPDNEPHNQPVSYADIAKSAEKQRCNKPSVSERKKTAAQEKSPVVRTIEPEQTPPKPTKSKLQEPEKEQTVLSPTTKLVETPPPPVNNKPDLGSLDNWPEIRNNKANAVKALFEGGHDWPTIQNNNGIKSQMIDNKLKSPPLTKINARPINNVKSTKSPPKQLEELDVVLPVPLNINIVKENNILNSTHKVIQSVSEQQQKLPYQCQMPPNIRDVQSIEKMQYKNLQNSPYLNNGAGGGDPLSPEHSLHVEMPVVVPVAPVVYDKRPAVVILSGADKHISDITFGFDINEQLLCGDICADFVSRFYMPEVPQVKHIDQIVDYIGAEWEDVVVQTNSGKVKYYTEDL